MVEVELESSTSLTDLIEFCTDKGLIKTNDVIFVDGETNK